MELKKGLIDALNWRYATKKFDSEKKINEKDFEELLEALRLSPSSFGIQPWKFLIVENKKLREELKGAAWGQSQIVDASHLIVLCSIRDMDESHADYFINQTAKIRGIKPEELEGFREMLLNSINGKSKLSLEEWNAKQVYLALGVLLISCAIKRIDACPMEGFDSKEFDRILGLGEKGLHTEVVCTLGYRDKDDKYSLLNKVRFDKDRVFEVI